MNLLSLGPAATVRDILGLFAKVTPKQRRFTAASNWSHCSEAIVSA